MRTFPHSALALPMLLATVVTAVTLAGCGQSSGVGTSASGQGTSASGAVPAQVPASLLHGPLGCPAGTGVLVLQRVAVVLAHLVTVVVARCDSGAGSPPSGVYVVDGTGAAARVTDTLVRADQELQIATVTAVAGGLRATGLGYSGVDVPRCCPDVHVTLDWRIQGGGLVPTV